MGSNAPVLPSVDSLILSFFSDGLVSSKFRTLIEILQCLGSGALTASMRIRLSFFDCVSRIVKRVCFVVRPVVGDAPDNLLRVVAASEGTLGVGPIRFGLAAMAGGYSAGRAVAVRKTTRRLGRVFVNREIGQVVNRI